MIIFDRKNLYDAKQRANISALQRRIMAILDDFNREAISLGIASKFDSETAMFAFSKYPELNKKMNALMKAVSDKIVNDILVSQQTAFQISADKSEKMIDSYAGINRSLINSVPESDMVVGKEAIARMRARNEEALSAFQKRKAGGISLSDRIWKIAGQAKTEVELTLDTGLAKGESASIMAKNIRQYMTNPDKLFRRVRDKYGDLQLSKPAKAYHPGQGVYRSSYRNALRLAGTETNIAYHTADFNSWINNDLVIGIEVILSDNHPIEDICDELKGRYPKEFEFIGWHPACRCQAIPITPENPDFMRYVKDGCPSDYTFDGSIDELPPNFNKWVEDNSSRIDRMKERGKLPYFLKQNSSLIKGR